MVRLAVLAASAALTAAPVVVVAQQIFDVWSTTWDRSSLFAYENLSPNPINFVSPGSTGAADITIDDTSVLQSMVGYGATLTDSSAQLLSTLKSQNSGNYNSILNTLFNPTDSSTGTAGLSYLRVPLGASDFSSSAYSFDDVSGDTSLNNFNIDNAPSYLFSVIKDIQTVNPYLKIHLLPWSPPGWMKDSGTMKGGSFISSYSSVYANYLLKALQGFKNKGITAYAIGIQNEPENSDTTYPTCLITADQEAQIGAALRSLMNSNGFSSTRIIGYDHNWIDAAAYPVTLMNDASSAFAGVAFHCYLGSVGQQDSFHNAYPNKEIYFTECSGQYGTDWWSDIKWYMDTIFIGAAEHYASSGLLWALALDGNGNPKLPGTDSCSTPCRPVVTINNDGSYSYNQEFYVLAQASKAILPKDTNGPFGKRIGVSLSGGSAWALRVTAYVTARTNSADWLRYSLVVLNWDDTTNGSWDPTPVTATIEFRGQQATYTFLVGVTTLTWYAANQGHSRREDGVKFTELFGNNSTFVPAQNEPEEEPKLFRFRRHV
ncbi:glycoside hydrolase [Cerioporus squamosus]|nr:glycoside hydrolase [Cerioporus squamosus]